MIFNEQGPYNYASAMDREYVANTQPEFMTAYHGMPIERPMQSEEISEPILTTGQIGQTVSEGPGQGTFLESVQGAIRKGAKAVELSISTRAPGTGPDSYTKEKLREIREMAKANQVELVSVHVPVEKVGNLSGYNPQQGFIEEQRFMQVNEVKKAIKFAAETTDGGAIVVHTGEFQRVMSEQPWARTKYGDFRAYEEEPDRFVAYLVDDRTGRVVTDVKKTQVVYEPVYITARERGLAGKTDPKTGHVFRETDWVNIKDQWLDPANTEQLFERVPKWNPDKTNFEVKRVTWDDFKKRAEAWNKEHAAEIARNPDRYVSAEEMFMRTQMENRVLQAKGSSLFHAQHYEHYKEQYDKLRGALKFYEELEKKVPPEEQWKIMKERRTGLPPDIAVPENVLPTQYIKEMMKQAEDSMRYIHEASSSADAQARQIEEDMTHIKSVAKFAKEQSVKSYAEAVLYAIDITNEHKLNNPLFIAPENILPEYGYGSHPNELIELVNLTRERVKERLMVERNMSEHRAEELAKRHVMATLDTEHLGIWRKHFVRKSAETDEDFKKRFDGWYMEQVKKLHEAGIIGHLHIADGFGYENANLPAGTGVIPVVDAVTYLVKHGFKGPFLSEGYGDSERMLRQTWKAFGSPIYSFVGPVAPGAPVRWSDVQHSYFGHTNPPNYVFGAYAPSNDWTLWSQTPME